MLWRSIAERGSGGVEGAIVMCGVVEVVARAEVFSATVDCVGAAGGTSVLSSKTSIAVASGSKVCAIRFS